ncbi:Coenzyme F420 hydrogenase/dehydrogenase, beta subunit C-terminal domain [Fibrobacter sp. UWS1]|uniref:Coenzyme F420 hydrogenase/dehydrogenase, beta subunit C-terminal domain n=1 Tax=Fibrobacter sp. UWS1 TaxID=1896220 RepID=UPI000BB107C3|nr:Coenzyme F420 hydrogenase/dehydrogenase, beta subunit C-terminal domain [Fibrobacter sp. UWS1]PBC67171.1 coenzyme F420 hydrogenase subunit beta [Fibrobacter sp. UWS1]
MKSVRYTTQNALCTGCGICEDMCAKNAISINRSNGVNIPIVDESTCVNCGRCLKVCPGIGGNLENSRKQLFEIDSVKHDKLIGPYTSIYSGYSRDDEIRLHSASGGVISQFLIYLLEQKIIDGAVVTGFSKDDNITPVSYIARCKEDVLNAKSTKYCPVSLNKIGNEIANSEGKYVIVGIPCHIQGFRKRSAIDKKFKEHLFGLFSVYCSSNRNFNAQDFLFKKYGVMKTGISYFAYRDNGCLGNMVINTGEKNISVPFINYYGRLRSFFKPHRCSLCVDHYGMLADVSFGDLHIHPYSNDKVGISSWIVRNPVFEELFKKASDEGYIKMDPLEPHVLNESQKEMLYPKKRRVRAQMNWDRFFGHKVPEYDVVLDEKPRLKDYITVVVAKMQAFVGRHKSLWFLIDLSNKGRK